VTSMFRERKKWGPIKHRLIEQHRVIGGRERTPPQLGSPLQDRDELNQGTGWHVMGEKKGSSNTKRLGGGERGLPYNM